MNEGLKGCRVMEETRKEKIKLFRKTDLIVIAVIIAFAVLFRIAYNSIFAGKAARAEIYYYSELVETVDLVSGQERIFSVAQEEDVVFLLDKWGNIQFIRSDCPDKVCINAGKLHMVGQSAACLPNGIVVKIVPQGERNEDDPDIIVGR